MKKSFFEFMDNYDTEISPEKYDISEKKVKKLVMNKIHPKSGFRESRMRKRNFAIVAAVSVVSVTGAAVAAYEMTVEDSAVNFFESGAGLLSQPQSLSKTDLETIKNNLKERNILIGSQGTTIKLIGSMLDENVIYLFCRLTAPEGTVLGNNSGYEFEEMYFIDPSENIGGKRSCSMSLDVSFAEDYNPHDNIIDFACIIQCEGQLKTDELNGIILRNLKEVREDEDTEKGNSVINPPKVIKGHWGIPVEIAHEATMAELLKEPVTVNIPEQIAKGYEKPTKEEIENTGRTHPLKLTSVLISPLSIKFEIEPNKLNLKADAEIVMKDGSVSFHVDTIFNAFTFGKYMTVFFNKPIDVSEIDYIRLCDAKIYVN